MTAARYGLGLVLFALTAGAVVAGARVLRQWLLPGWRGVNDVLVTTVLAVSMVIVVAEVLGTFGQFRTAPLVVALVAVGGGLALAGARPGTTDAAPGTEPSGTEPSALDPSGTDPSGTDPPSTEPPAPGDDGRVATIVFGVATAVVAVPWLARTVRAVDEGMTTIDTLWYHLPAAARFVQTGRLTSIQYFDADPTTAFFPFNSSVLHGVGMLVFDIDLVSVLVNVAWLALALAAGWSIGQNFRRPAHCALGVILLLATPHLLVTQPGGAYNDVTGVALLLAAVAIALAAPPGGNQRSVGQDVVVGLAAGLAIGMKLSFLGPGVVLCLGLVALAPAGARVRRAAAVVPAALLTGGYWFVRNTVATGSPLPSLDVGLGPVELPSVDGTLPTSSAGQFLFDAHAWSHGLLSGFRDAYGPLWPVVVGLATLGLVGAVVSRDRRLRVLGIAGGLAGVIFVVTPQFLELAPSEPILFATNLRYATPAMALGLVLAPVVVGRFADWVLAATAIALLATQVEPVAWPTGVGWGSFFEDRIDTANTFRGIGVLAVGLLLVAAVVLVGRAVADRRAAGTVPRHRLVAAGIGVVCLVAIVVLGAGRSQYVRTRYADPLYRWARPVHDARIGVYGMNAQLQYPFVGADLSNVVRYLNVEENGGDIRRARTCHEWVDLLVDGRYDYVGVRSQELEKWTRAQPDAREVVQVVLEGDPRPEVVFRLDGDRRARQC